MNQYTLIAGVNGTGKSSLRGVLEGEGMYLGHIIDPDLIAKENNFNTISAGKKALRIIKDCLEKNISFTQETTLSGHSVRQTIKQARLQGYFISMFYVGLNSCEESLVRIENRVRKGGHNIPTSDVVRRYEKRIGTLSDVIFLCDQVTFYDNENGFIKVAEIENGVFRFVNGYCPNWIKDIQTAFNQQKL